MGQNNKPKKLIRDLVVEKLKEGEFEYITDQAELNKLYSLKIKEELLEIQNSDYKDISEFIDLIQVAFSFACQNGFTREQISVAFDMKQKTKGSITNIALNNLNPNNPSNYPYFESTADREMLSYITNKATKYDELESKISTFYSEDENDHPADLSDIGLMVTEHFGFH